MQLHNLKSHTGLRKKKVVGRGGKRGTTSGKGTKGQKARAGHRIRPEIRDMIKKLPRLRGRGKNYLKTVTLLGAVVNLVDSERHFKAGETVNPSALFTAGLINKEGGRLPKVKILGKGTLSKKLIFKDCEFSRSVALKLGHE